MVEADGGRVFKVNCAYTSKKCHVCQSDLDMSDYSNPHCSTCGITHHRDLNAAANIAQRVNVKKACETRSKYATARKARKSKCHPKPLKHPGTKNKPTPKAPQNQKRKTHTITTTPAREVSVRMCPADHRVSAVDHNTWFQTTSGTTNPMENLSTANTADVVYLKE